MSDSGALLGAVEAGGTKFRAAVFNHDLEMVSDVRVPTTTPDETLAAMVDFFKAQPPVVSLGIASFGPLIVDPASPDYGSIAATPKPGWSHAPVLTRLRDELGIPAEIQTDVEAAAVAEYQVGAGQGCHSVAYVTVGTGIGIGVAHNGVPFRGRDHIEMGHIPVSQAPGDEFTGGCPFHGNCLEGMASGPAIEQRWGSSASTLTDRDEVWAIEADYLAQLVQVLAYSFAPDRILFSGGVGARDGLSDLISSAAIARLAGYSVSHANNADLVARAALGNEAGLTGAAILAASLT